MKNSKVKYFIAGLLVWPLLAHFVLVMDLRGYNIVSYYLSESYVNPDSGMHSRIMVIVSVIPSALLSYTMVLFYRKNYCI